MDGTEYDVVVCGTGFSESILSGLLSLEGKKVLHIDRNGYYGDEGASLNLTALWEKFKGGAKPPERYGSNRDWNVDLIPKFVMASGKLVKMLLKTQVSYYLRWKPVDATYVYQYQEAGLFSSAKGRVEKVPSTAAEALSSKLMGFMEKRRFKIFIEWVGDLDLSKPATWKGNNLKAMTFAQLAKKFSLGSNTLDFVGHAVALYTSDSYLKQPCIPTLERMLLYLDSIGRFGNTPFIYPIYGLGGIPEGFSRKCAVGGGTFILNQGITGIEFDANGQVCEVTDGDKTAKTKMVIASPQYMLATGQSHKVKQVGQVIRCICILPKQVAALKTNTSAQIIIPQKQTGRKSDIYIMVVGSDHATCQAGFFLAIISATVETKEPEKELDVAFEIVGKPLEKFITVNPLYEPTNGGLEAKNDGIFVTSTLDPTSNFESAALDVLRVYKLITGKDLDLENLPEDIDE